jgi:CDP-diacylglycerol--inositol 3-phosphatidyltransferase
MLAGSSSHKNASPDRDGHLLTLYYTNRIVLGGVCLFNEFFFIGLYAYAHFQPSWLRLAVALIAPVFAFKQYLSLIQLWNSCKIVATHDANERNKQ